MAAGFKFFYKICARRTPSFVDQMLEADNGLGEVMKPPEKSFWAKYVSYCFKYVVTAFNFSFYVCILMFLTCSPLASDLFCSGCTSFLLVSLS